MAVRTINFYGAYSTFIPILDTYPAIFAVSNRKLSTTATKCMRVRRSSDNAEMDIGFSGYFLDTATLLTFVGASNGFVVTKYNQGYGGSIYDAVQNAGANQARIVNGGVLSLNPQTGKADEYYYNRNHWLEIDQLGVDFGGIMTDRSSFVVSKNDETSDAIMFSFAKTLDNTVVQAFCRTNPTSNIYIRQPNNVDLLIPSGVNDLNVRLITAQIQEVGAQKLAVNGVDTSTLTHTFTQSFPLNNASIGKFRRGSGELPFKGYISEVIFRDEYSTTDRQLIDNDITNYYGI